MSDKIGQEEFARMFMGAAARIREQHSMLSELDSAVGDGDHGATMVRIAEQLETTVVGWETSDIKTLLRDTGWRVLGVDGGASSSLLGTFILGMADAPLVGKLFDCGELATTFEAGLTALSRQTPAQLGDKTMMDALVPAVGALRAAAAVRRSAMEALADAARAACAGAESTSSLTARYGRAKFLGEKARGHKDPGAASVALMFEGFSRSIGGEKEATGSA